MIILGISAFYHDSAAAIIKNGRIIAAAQEERFSRVKNDSRFPEKAIKYCLSEIDISLEEVNYIVFFEKPFLKFERLLETYLSYFPYGFNSFKKSMILWIKEKLFQKKILINNFYKISKKEISKKELKEKLIFSEHHVSHAASAFFPSPFKKAIILTIDGVGEWTTTSVSIGQKNGIQVQKEIHFPHSIGLLYSAFTAYLGFKVNSGEYKLMGLAPYGQPKYKDLILTHIIDLKEDGSYRLNMQYFNYASGLTMVNKKFINLFKQNTRNEGEKITQNMMDIAASIQVVTEEIIDKIVHSLSIEYPDIDNLCLAGGVALNCVSNGKLLKKNYFKKIWIQPAANDAGGATGAALIAYYGHLNYPRDKVDIPDSMQGSLLGPSFDDNTIKSCLKKLDADFVFYKTQDDLITKTAQSIQDGKVIGWFQGRMEYGPRALGNRSIIADARCPTMQKKVNSKIKYRESFRPFAPSVLSEHANEWFDLNIASPYMLFVSSVKEKHILSNCDILPKGLKKLNTARTTIPSVTHIDNSARIQTVDKETNPLYHALISKFYDLTSCPIILNTSFNVRGEPIVCTPEDAFQCFMNTEMDMLVMGNYVIHKKENRELLKKT